MKCSICLSTHNKPQILRRVLDSIYRQAVPFKFETIIVDDNSITTETKGVCGCYPVQYHWIDREPGFLNPARARNIAYRAAKGEVVICQSDEVVHITDNCIERLVNDLTPGHFLIANVFNVDDSGTIIPHNRDNPDYHPMEVYTGPTNPRPFFFLGSLYRKDLYAIGGNDEEFVAPGYDDNWLANCLVKGLGLQPIYTTEIVGHHLHHKHYATNENVAPSKLLYERKRSDAKRGLIPWCASGGAWPCDP